MSLSRPGRWLRRLALLAVAAVLLLQLWYLGWIVCTDGPTRGKPPSCRASGRALRRSAPAPG